MRVPVGIDITETWEVDHCEEMGRYAVDLWKRVAERARAELDALPADAPERAAVLARAASADGARAEAERELKAYVPGSGPRFVIGHIPATKRAEIAGMMADAERHATDREKLAAQHAWRREVVRFAVRGHANLRTTKGAELPFESESVTLPGATLSVPTERQIERYGQILADLANVAMAPQDLDESSKNG